MTPTLHQRAKAIFLSACELSPAERAALVARECAGDAALIAAVERMLANDADPHRLEPGAELRGRLEKILEHAAGGSGGSGAATGAGQASGGEERSAPGAEGGASSSTKVGSDGERVGRRSGHVSNSRRDGALLSDHPQQIGGYRIVALLGEGGFGFVYEAEQSEPVRRSVALKVIKLGMDTRQVIARFAAERQTLAMMDHPSIAKVYDAGQTEAGRPYFAMELVAGVPLTAYCDERKLPPRARLELFIRVCQAVQHAHQKGIIHRDLKPSNVLVAEHDGRPLPKLIDFGISRALDDSLGGGMAFTEQGQMIGTPQYMSVEQAAGDSRLIDVRSDVYALGVILYELLVGRTPHDVRNRTPLEATRLIREVEPARLSTINPRFRGDIETIVAKALEKDKERRYQSAAEFAADLSRYLNDEPVLARPASASYRFWKFARRHKGLVLGTAAVAVALVAGFIGTTIGLLQARAAEKTARMEADLAQAMNDFINNDLLASVSPDVGSRDIRLREVLDSASRRIDGKFPDRPEVEVGLRRTLGRTYGSLGEAALAEPLLTRALELCERSFGAENARTVLARCDMAELRMLQGRYDEAERMLRDVVMSERKLFGEDHVDTNRTVIYLSSTLLSLGRLAEAEELATGALERLRRRYGESHRETLHAMDNLGIVYSRQGRLTEAESLQRRALEKRLATRGADDLDTVMSTYNLAQQYTRAGRFDDAEPLLREVVDHWDRALGPDNPTSLQGVIALAGVYYERGQLAEAVPLYERALARLRATVGPGHATTLVAMNSLGKVYRWLGRNEEAESLFTEALAQLKARPDGNEPLRYVLTSSLAELYRLQRRFAEAEPLFETVLDSFRRMYGDEHRDTLVAMNNLAQIYSERGRATDAEALMKTAVASARRRMPAGHWLIGAYLATYGAALRELRRFEEAERSMMEAREILVAAFGEEHARLRRLSASLTRLYEMWDRPDEARQWREKAGTASAPAEAD